MTCCGKLIKITSMDDPIPVLLCQQCGKQGPPSAFPDPPEEPYEIEKPSLLKRITRLFA